MKNLREALKALNNLKKEGVVKDYAIGGGIAAMLYCEPTSVTGMDVFFIPAQESTHSDELTPIHRRFRTQKVLYRRNYHLVKRVRVQFIPANNNLIREAIAHPQKIKYRGVTAKLISGEYFVATHFDAPYIESFDQLFAIKILTQSRINEEKIREILRKYNREEAYNRFYKDLQDNIREVQEKNARSLTKQMCDHFKAKEEWRVEMAKLPFAQKMKDVGEMQRASEFLIIRHHTKQKSKKAKT